MARPKKEGMDYFPHDTDAVNDEKIEAMRALFGNDGYAFYFILLERIYRADGGELDVSNFTVRTVLISKLGIKQEAFDSMLDAAFEIGLFDRSVYKDRQCITSSGIKSRWEEVDSQRKKWRKNKGETAGNNNRADDNDSYPDRKHELPAEKSAQSKVKESKENKSKGNTKEDPPIIPPEGKLKFSEMVYLSQHEADQLIQEFGEKEFKYWVQQLSDYHVENINKPSKIKKDHNRTIRNWIRSDQRRREQRGGKPQKRTGLTEEELRELENEI